MRITFSLVRSAGRTVMIGARGTMMIRTVLCLTIAMVVSDIGLAPAMLVAATACNHIAVLPDI